MIAVLCESRPGLRNSERSLTVFGLNGNKQYFRVEGYYLREEGGRTYLPVTFIDEDAEKVLVEFPYEADSGAWRMFVPRENVIEIEVNP